MNALSTVQIFINSFTENYEAAASVLQPDPIHKTFPSLSKKQLSVPWVH